MIYKTNRLNLEYGDLYEPDWKTFTDRNLATLDRQFFGSFAVVPAENPSSSLNYLIRGGTYVGEDGFLHAVADSASRAANATGNTYIYLKEDGTFSPAGATAWPGAGAGKFHPLAIVAASGGVITAILDARYPLPLLGS